MGGEYEAKESVRIARRLYATDHTRYYSGLSDALRSLGAVYMTMALTCNDDPSHASTDARDGLLDAAEEAFEEALKISRTFSSEAGVIKNLCSLASCHWRQGKYGVVLDELKEVLSLGRREMKK